MLCLICFRYLSGDVEFVVKFMNLEFGGKVFLIRIKVWKFLLDSFRILRLEIIKIVSVD